jgi:hypothetical protein
MENLAVEVPAVTDLEARNRRHLPFHVYLGTLIGALVVVAITIWTRIWSICSWPAAYGGVMPSASSAPSKSTNRISMRCFRSNRKRWPECYFAGGRLHIPAGLPPGFIWHQAAGLILTPRS